MLTTTTEIKLAETIMTMFRIWPCFAALDCPGAEVPVALELPDFNVVLVAEATATVGTVGGKFVSDKRWVIATEKSPK